MGSGSFIGTWDKHIFLSREKRTKTRSIFSKQENTHDWVGSCKTGTWLPPLTWGNHSSSNPGDRGTGIAAPITLWITENSSMALYWWETDPKLPVWLLLSRAHEHIVSTGGWGQSLGSRVTPPRICFWTHLCDLVQITSLLYDSVSSFIK